MGIVKKSRKTVYFVSTISAIVMGLWCFQATSKGIWRSHDGAFEANLRCENFPISAAQMQSQATVPNLAREVKKEDAFFSDSSSASTGILNLFRPDGQLVVGKDSNEVLLPVQSSPSANSSCGPPTAANSSVIGYARVNLGNPSKISPITDASMSIVTMARSSAQTLLGMSRVDSKSISVSVELSQAGQRLILPFPKPTYNERHFIFTMAAPSREVHAYCSYHTKLPYRWNLTLFDSKTEPMGKSLWEVIQNPDTSAYTTKDFTPADWLNQAWIYPYFALKFDSTSSREAAYSSFLKGEGGNSYLRYSNEGRRLVLSDFAVEEDRSSVLREHAEGQLSEGEKISDYEEADLIDLYRTDAAKTTNDSIGRLGAICSSHEEKVYVQMALNPVTTVYDLNGRVIRRFYDPGDADLSCLYGNEPQKCEREAAKTRLQDRLKNLMSRTAEGRDRRSFDGLAVSQGGAVLRSYTEKDSRVARIDGFTKNGAPLFLGVPLPEGTTLLSGSSSAPAIYFLKTSTEKREANGSLTQPDYTVMKCSPRGDPVVLRTERLP